MDLKECIEKMKVIWEQDRPFRTGEANEVYQTLISFCELALKLQESGIPKKICGKEKEYINGWNDCHDEWTAYFTNRMNILCDNCKKIFLDNKDKL